MTEAVWQVTAWGLERKNNDGSTSKIRFEDTNKNGIFDNNDIAKIESGTWNLRNFIPNSTNPLDVSIFDKFGYQNLDTTNPIAPDLEVNQENNIMNKTFNVGSLYRLIKGPEIDASNTPEQVNKTEQSAPTAPTTPTANATKAEQTAKPSEPPIVGSIEDNIGIIQQRTGLPEATIRQIIVNEGIKLNKYKDEAGVYTIGVGHNIDADTDYYKNGYTDTITQEQACILFIEDLQKAERQANSLTNVQLNASQKGVIVDLIFNLGFHKLKTEAPNFNTHIQNGDFEKAACEIDFITVTDKNKVKHVDPGLVLRNFRRIDIFINGEFTPEIIAKMEELRARGMAVSHSSYYETESQRLIDEAKAKMKAKAEEK